MKEWKSLENQLRSWTPRHPSAKLKTRIFGPAAEAAWPAEPFHNWAWLAPVMGCFLVLTVISGSHNHLASVDTSKDADWLNLAASNQSYVAYLMADFHSEQNSPQREVVQWTSSVHRSEESRPFSVAKTNSMIR